MAKITYADKVALNENPNVNAINKVRDVDMNEIKEVINDNETKVLLAVSSSAPATCDTGDIYFNTTDNLIYTATATNTWSSTGIAPTENTIYIEFTSQTAYAYDGTTLVSVGGGAGGGGETLPVGSEIDFDGSVSDIPTGWEQVDDVPVYSTTETVCGTWIDGKPIYRRVYQLTLPSSSSDSVIISGLNNIEVINISGMATSIQGSDTFKFEINSYHSDTWSIVVYIYGTQIRCKIGSSFYGASANIILEYTKTTD